MFLLKLWSFRITYPTENYFKEVFHVFWILRNIEQSNRIIKTLEIFTFLSVNEPKKLWPPYRKSPMYDVTSHWQLWLNHWFAWRHPLPPGLPWLLFARWSALTAWACGVRTSARKITQRPFGIILRHFSFFLQMNWFNWWSREYVKTKACRTLGTR